MAKKDQKMTLMLEEELKDKLAQIAFANDVNGSELVRSCILLALPVFESTPTLINMIPTLPVQRNRTVTG